jgi:hypothetical protein
MSDPAIVFAFIVMSGVLLIIGMWLGKAYYSQVYYRLGFRAGERAAEEDFASRVNAPAIKISPRPFRNGIMRNN